MVNVFKKIWKEILIVSDNTLAAEDPSKFLKMSRSSAQQVKEG